MEIIVGYPASHLWIAKDFLGSFTPICQILNDKIFVM